MASLSVPRSRLRRLWDRLENPVLGREFRSRMRGPRSYVITGVYTLLVMAFVLGAYWFLAGQEAPAAPRTPGAPSAALQRHAADVGRGIWTWGCIIQAMLLPLVVPAFTCGAITLERERDLLELLLLTRQSAFQICLGKLGSGAGLGLTLVLASVPVLALSALLGGVAPVEMLETLAVLVGAILVSGAMGLAASSVARRTSAATAIVYLVIGTGMIGLPVLMTAMGWARSLTDSGSEVGILAMLLACMLVAFPPAVGAAVLIAAFRRRRSGRPPERTWWMLTTGLCWCALLLFLYLPGVSDLLIKGQAMVLVHPVVAIMGVMIPEVSLANSLYPHLWWISTFFYLGAAVWLFYVATLRVQRLRL